MKPYGVDRKDRGCCPGHDKYPPDRYDNERSRRAHSRARHQAHSRERARERVASADARVDVDTDEAHPEGCPSCGGELSHFEHMLRCSRCGELYDNDEPNEE